MKKYFRSSLLVTVLMFAIAPFAVAQTSDICTQIESLDMSAEQAKAAVAMCNAATNQATQAATRIPADVNKVGEIATSVSDAILKVANGLGVAVNEFLSTDAGTLTAGLIVWHVAGETLVGYIVGLILFAIFTAVYFRLLRSNLIDGTETVRQERGALTGWLLGREKVTVVPKYRSFRDITNNDLQTAIVVSGLVYIAVMTGTAASFF